MIRQDQVGKDAGLVDGQVRIINTRFVILDILEHYSTTRVDH